MVRSFTEHSQQERPLLGGVKGRGDHHVGPRVESEETKYRASVSECYSSCFLLDHVDTIGTILLHL